MSDDDSMAAAFREAVRIAGGQVLFAGLIGRTQSAVSKMLKAERPLPAENVLTVEEATGISRHDLRPDIYPREGVLPVRDGDPFEEARP
ncbi:MAG: hypothetical protein DI606_04285 [Sphingobium sp.]|uniref:transcriptional regulator n=1 Tax=Sphingobium sp. TaxID=1912891 RepID=UPI000DB42EA9|nr:YdaS family helix-turn-helix protein [Sphingobium sp.]PZU13792.1 MAG: hypothetical protein DI606_04285 [Sphingobium sp.]